MIFDVSAEEILINRFDNILVLSPGKYRASRMVLIHCPARRLSVWAWILSQLKECCDGKHGFWDKWKSKHGF